MSAEPKPYSQVYIQAWTLLSVIAGLVLFGMLVFGQHLLHLGNWIWDLVRYLASPII